MSNHMLAHVFGIHCHMCASFTTGTFVYCTVLYRIQYFYFESRMSKSKCKSSGDVAGTAKKHQGIMMETKVKIIEKVE